MIIFFTRSFFLQFGFYNFYFQIMYKAKKAARTYCSTYPINWVSVDNVIPNQFFWQILQDRKFPALLYLEINYTTNFVDDFSPSI
jgi:phenylalanine-4-hydroxylase